MSKDASGPGFAASVRVLVLVAAPMVLVVMSACSGGGSGTEVPGASAGAALNGGVGGAAPGTGGAGAVGGVGGATGGVGGATAGAAGTTAGVGGATGGVSGVGGTVAGAGGAVSGAGGAPAGAGGTQAGSAGAGGALGGAAGTGGVAAGSAGTASGGSAGFTPAVDRTTAWNDPDYGCGNCHGEQGEGIEMRGPEIRHPNRELFDFMVRTGDAMPLALYRDPMKPATEAMVSVAILDDIFTWLSSFPKPTTGAELFADYCSYCHAPDGRGGTLNGYASAMHSAPFDETAAGFLEHVREGHVQSGAGGAIDVSNRAEWMPPFPASVLTDQEISLIEAWLPQN